MSIFPDWLMRVSQSVQNYVADVVIELDVTPEIYEFELSTPYASFETENVDIEFTTEIIQEVLENSYGKCRSRRFNSKGCN